MREIAKKQESIAQSSRKFYIAEPTWTRCNKPSVNKPNTSNPTATQEEVARYVACVFAPTDMVEVRRLRFQGDYYFSDTFINALEHFLPVPISHEQSPLSFTMRDP